MLGLLIETSRLGNDADHARNMSIGFSHGRSASGAGFGIDYTIIGIIGL